MLFSQNERRRQATHLGWASKKKGLALLARKETLEAGYAPHKGVMETDVFFEGGSGLTKTPEASCTPRMGNKSNAPVPY